MDWPELSPQRIYPIRWKLLTYFLTFFLIIVFVGVYANLGSKLSTRLFGDLLLEGRRLEELDQKLSALKYYAEEYLANGMYVNLEDYFESNADLRDALDWVRRFSTTFRDRDKRFLYIDLANSVSAVLDLSEKAVDARRSGFQEESYTLSQRAVKAAEVTRQYIVYLMNRNTVEGNRQYGFIIAHTRRVEFLSYLLAAAIAALGIVFVLEFSMGITEPLNRIIAKAQVLAAGDFQVSEVHVNSNDELQIIAGVFNRMAKSIRDLFEKTEEKVLLERQLKEEKMRNLEIASLLRESELRALQAQVNPHFLYNTLNAISQVAILEGADETAELGKMVAQLLRYNLRRLDKPVSIRDEIGSVEMYLRIMKVRYGDQIAYEIICPEELDDYLIPCMTIQPLVENAVIHGIGKTGRKGHVWVSVSIEQGLLIARIRDDGVGMEPDTIRALLSDGGSDVGSPKGHTTGLGIRNIVKRLHFFYGTDVVNITSEPGEGTIVELRLPLRKGESQSVQSASG